MTTMTANLQSWIESANTPGNDFPIQNLPLGIFRRHGSTDDPGIGVAIGDQVLDVRACVEAGIIKALTPDPETACALCATTLNAFMAQGRSSWTGTRAALTTLLVADTPDLRDDPTLRERCLVPMTDADMLLPATIGDYTDFYASLHHATNVGSMFRPDNPLLPNYKHLPVGYHGRSSSIVADGTPIRRPQGQLRPDDNAPPIFGPSRLLDYELEMAFFVGPGNEQGERISMTNALENIFGMVILNDWSARDVQKWEYQPLGPFNAKNFATSVSPWIVSLEALEPYRVAQPPRGADDPPVLDYLQPAGDAAYDITVEVYLASQKMRDAGTEPLRMSRGSFTDMYWTIAQMLVHHSSTGCNLRPGDLLASGTVSGPTDESRGSMLERTWRGQHPIELPDGTSRKFLADGDEVTFRAFCERPGAPRIGFGECRGVILPVLE